MATSHNADANARERGPDLLLIEVQTTDSVWRLLKTPKMTHLQHYRTCANMPQRQIPGHDTTNIIQGMKSAQVPIYRKKRLKKMYYMFDEALHHKDEITSFVGNWIECVK